MRAIGYLGWAGGTLIALIVVDTAFTVAVDPYRMYGSAPVAGLTALKPRASQQLVLAKTYQIERVQPKTLLLGNSRVEIGFDPESQQWPVDTHPIFNAGISGGSLFTARRLLQESAAVRPPATVIVAMDFPDFLEEPTPTNAEPPPTADEKRLLVDRNGGPNPARAIQIWRDRLSTTLSIDALIDSVYTVFDQNEKTGGTMTPLGFNPLREYQIYVKRNGYYKIFSQKNAIYFKQYKNYQKSEFDDLSRLASFRELDKIIYEVGKTDSQLVLFINPYHSDYLEILRRTGFWPIFEAWKRALVRALEAHQKRGRNAILLIDFSGYDEMTTEPVPPAGDTHSEMRWYWESGHYKAALGDRMIARMFGREGGIGRTLTSTTVDAVLASIRNSRERFIAPIEAQPR